MTGQSLDLQGPASQDAELWTLSGGVAMKGLRSRPRRHLRRPGAVVVGEGVRAFETPAAAALQVEEVRQLDESQNVLVRYGLPTSS